MLPIGYIHIYVYICVYICMYVYKYNYIIIYIHTYIYIHKYIYTYPPPCPCGTKWSDRGSTAAVLVGWMDWFKGARPLGLRTVAYTCMTFLDLFFHHFFGIVFWSIFHGFWSHLGLPNPSKIHQKSNKNWYQNLLAFFIDVLLMLCRA